MTEKKINYNKRVFLNNEDSHFTGSVVLCDAVNIINQNKFVERHTFVEISDCHSKIRLHPDKNLPIEDFAAKLDLLAKELMQFAFVLRSMEKDESFIVKEPTYFASQTTVVLAAEELKKHISCTEPDIKNAIAVQEAVLKANNLI